MNNIYQFLDGLNQELSEIEDRLSENLIVFADLEDTQSLTAQEVHNLIYSSSPGSGFGSGSGSGSGRGNGNGNGNGNNEDSDEA
jgi:hypothetical protein